MGELNGNWTAFAERDGWSAAHAARAREWCESGERTVEELAAHDPGWVCVLSQYATVPEALLRECARRCPHEALRWCGETLPPAVLAECARQDPKSALLFAPVRLPTAVLDECARKHPELALRGEARWVLSRETLRWCARREPLSALRFARQLLSDEELVGAARALPDHVLARVLREAGRAGLW